MIKTELTDRDRNTVREARLALRRLTVYRGLRQDSSFRAMAELLEMTERDNPSTDVIDAYHHLFAQIITLAEFSREKPVGDAWQNHLLDLLLADENSFSRKSELGPVAAGSLRAAAASDLAGLQSLYRLDAALLRRLAAVLYNTAARKAGDNTVPAADWPTWDRCSPLPGAGKTFNGDRTRQIKERLAASPAWPGEIESLAAFYRAAGSGIFGRYKAFRWVPGNTESGLEGVPEPDPIRLNELIGYRAEREEVIDNTRQFLRGYRANNVLLYGDRGTGKSSTIKAILNEYAEEGLRLVEVPKQYLRDFPRLVRALQNRPQRFIVYVDDLSFEENEWEYKELKAILEGSLAARPDNVVIYATSNRRHIVREWFSDRGAPREIADADELRQQDTLQEKLSLADRFGITVTFTAPDQKQYLEIVEGLATRRRLDIDPKVLRHRAIQWELWHNGRSGRTARQFIDYLEGELGLTADDEANAPEGEKR